MGHDGNDVCAAARRLYSRRHRSCPGYRLMMYGAMLVATYVRLGLFVVHLLLILLYPRASWVMYTGFLICVVIWETQKGTGKRCN